MRFKIQLELRKDTGKTYYPIIVKKQADLSTLWNTAEVSVFTCCTRNTPSSITKP